jgi:hypothetical protein
MEMKYSLKIAGMALVLTSGAATAVVTMAGPATAACTFWPGRDNSAFQNCMELERQRIEMQRMQSEQWTQQQQMRQQMQQMQQQMRRARPGAS